jgi:AcrR family transcriptional regulator
MAVYTHFGGIPELLEAIAADGFRRFALHVDVVPATDDSMADFFAKGMAYREWALQNPQLYRLMFGLTHTFPGHPEADLTVSRTISKVSEGREAFDVMVRALERVKSGGMIHEVDTTIAAGQFLSATHGYVLLEMAGYFGSTGNGFAWVFGPMGLSIMVGLGATHEQAERSALNALQSSGIN